MENHNFSSTGNGKKARAVKVVEFDPTCARFESFPYPYFEKEPAGRFWKKFKKFETSADGNCMFQALSIGYFDNKKYWKKHVKNAMLEKILRFSFLELSRLYGLKSEQEVNEKHSKVIAVLSTDNFWGFLDHLALFEKCFNAAVWTWVQKDGLFQVHRKPQVDNNATLPKFLHLLHEGGDREDNCTHWSLLKPNVDFIEGTQRSSSQGFFDEDEMLSISDGLSDLCEEDFETLMDETDHFRNSDADILTEELLQQNILDLSVNDSFFTPTETSISSRPSNLQFQRNLTMLDLLELLSTKLGTAGVCCERNCLELFRYENNGFQIKSSFTSTPLESITKCRNFTKQLSQKDRSEFVENSYKAGFQRCVKDPKKHTFSMFVLMENDERVQVCRKTFDLCYGITHSMSARTRRRIAEDGIGSVGKRKMLSFVKATGDEEPESTSVGFLGYEICAFIRSFCEGRGERMPHSEETRISFPKRLVFEAFRNQRKKMYGSDAEGVDESKFYKIWNSYCADITKTRWKGDFAVCDVCKKSAQVDVNPYSSSEVRRNNKTSLRRHLKSVELMRHSYAYRRQKAIDYPSTYMSIIIDGCDSNTTTLPNIKTMSKTEDKYREHVLKHKVMGVRVHALRKRDYMYMAPPFLGKAVGSNYTIECLLKTLLYEEELRLQQGL